MNALSLIEKIGQGDPGLTLADKILGGAIITVLSMTIVFSVLVLLIIAIKIMGAALNKEKQEKEESPVQPQEIVEEISDEAEIVVAITAAIAEVMGKSQSQIRVKKIERVGAERPLWSIRGAQESMRNLK